MRPSDPHQPPSARPNLVSVNRKRAGPAGSILDQIEAGAGSAARGLELNARWLLASCALIAGLVASVAGIAYMNATTQRILPKADGPRPKVASAAGPAAPSAARIERVADGAPAGPPIGFEQAPGAVPATLPAPQAATAAAVQEPPAAGTAPTGAQPAAAASPPAPATLVASVRASPQRAARRQAAVRPRARPQPAVPSPQHEQDPDVELISAIRKATEKVAD